MADNKGGWTLTRIAVEKKKVEMLLKMVDTAVKEYIELKQELAGVLDSVEYIHERSKQPDLCKAALYSVYSSSCRILGLEPDPWDTWKNSTEDSND